MSSVVPNPMTSSSAPTPARTRLPATAQPLAVGGGLEESEQRRAEIVDGSIHALGWHGAAVFLWEIDVVADQRLQREHLLAQRPAPRRGRASPAPRPAPAGRRGCRSPPGPHRCRSPARGRPCTGRRPGFRRRAALPLAPDAPCGAGRPRTAAAPPPAP